jgi:hypothetical protein
VIRGLTRITLAYRGGLRAWAATLPLSALTTRHRPLPSFFAYETTRMHMQINEAGHSSPRDSQAGCECAPSSSKATSSWALSPRESHSACECAGRRQRCPWASGKLAAGHQLKPSWRIGPTPEGLQLSLRDLSLPSAGVARRSRRSLSSGASRCDVERALDILQQSHHLRRELLRT